jgi:serine/threonine-protein kinase
MGLTQKILLFTSLLVVALVLASLGYTTVQADRLAQENIERGLGETRTLWETFQSDRLSKLKMGIRALSNDPGLKSLLQLAIDERSSDAFGTVFNTLRERNEDVAADFILATDSAGIVLARSDRPGGANEDLSAVPIVMKPLEGEESSTVWRQGDQLFHAVSVPVATGGDVVGVLVAGYAINAALAAQIQKLSHSDVAFLIHPPGQPVRLSVSSLGRREAAFNASLSQPVFATGGGGPTFPLDLDGERFVAVQVPLKAAAGELVGSLVALRSVLQETASYRQFRNSLIVVSLVVMALGLGIAYVASRQITGPVRVLVDLVDRVRDGAYTGAVTVNSKDEIGVLARAFNNLLADLREKEQMIGFLREGMTLLRKGEQALASGDTGSAATMNISPATTGSTARLDRGSVFANRYEIQDSAGKGGMAIVYRAHDRQLDEEVALKFLRSEALRDDPTLLDRFKQEIKLSRRITHRNVVRIHDFGESNGVSYISMEFLDGVTLKELIRGRGAMPIGVGLGFAKQMCRGLEAAHSQGVVHRDIKPQNMLILSEAVELKIMDFGIARRQTMKEAAPDSSLTSAGMVMGTPDYMPPEQAQGQAADFRSDIYSLGVVMFETFTGKLPFTGDSISKIVWGHIQSPPPRPRALNPRIPPDLEDLILRCMAKDPAERPQNVDEVLDALSAVSSRVEAA